MYECIKPQPPLLAHCPALYVQTSHTIPLLLVVPPCIPPTLFSPYPEVLISAFSSSMTARSPHPYFPLQADSSRPPTALPLLQILQITNRGKRDSLCWCTEPLYFTDSSWCQLQLKQTSPCKVMVCLSRTTAGGSPPQERSADLHGCIFGW